MPPFLLLFSSLTKTEWRGLSATPNLGRCYHLLFTRSFCKIHMTILQIHIKNHSVMMYQVQSHCACFAAGSAIRMSLKFLTGTLLDTNGLSGDGGKCFTISSNLVWWMGGCWWHWCTISECCLSCRSSDAAHCLRLGNLIPLHGVL
jgi:hypothetical protein